MLKGLSSFQAPSDFLLSLTISLWEAGFGFVELLLVGREVARDNSGSGLVAGSNLKANSSFSPVSPTSTFVTPEALSGSASSSKVCLQREHRKDWEAPLTSSSETL
jgi:hypothetical protein